jgi:hypothetical protein
MIESKIKITNRKFYNKWLYKISLNVTGAGMFRVRTLDDIRAFCLGTEVEKMSSSHSLNTRAHGNRENILALAEFLLGQDSSLWSKRIETHQMDFYTNDKNFYDEISKKFEHILLHKFEPSEESKDLLDQPQTIVAKKLPHNRYNFKVYLLPHKLKGDKEAKKKYVEWLKSQSPRITCTKAVESWFVKTDWNWDRRYVLVEDEKTLLMLKLRNSEAVGRIYNYVICDK